MSEWLRICWLYCMSCGGVRYCQKELLSGGCQQTRIQTELVQICSGPAHTTRKPLTREGVPGWGTWVVLYNPCYLINIYISLSTFIYIKNSTMNYWLLKDYKFLDNDVILGAFLFYSNLWFFFLFFLQLVNWDIHLLFLTIHLPLFFDLKLSQKAQAPPTHSVKITVTILWQNFRIEAALFFCFVYLFWFRSYKKKKKKIVFKSWKMDKISPQAKYIK